MPQQSSPSFFALAVALVLGVFLASEVDFTYARPDVEYTTLDEMTEWAEGGNLVRRLAFPALGAFGLLCLLMPGNEGRRIDPYPVLLTVLYAAWCLLSLTWSIDMGLSARRLVVQSCCIVGAWGIGSRLGPGQLLRLALIVSLSFAALGVLAEAAEGSFQPLGERRFSGTAHPNTQALYLAVLCLSARSLLLAEVGRWKAPMAGILLGGLILLVSTKSRTSSLGILAALLTVGLIAVPRRTLALGGLLVWLGTAALLIGSLVSPRIESSLSNALLLGRAEEAESLTGRVPLWGQLLGYVAERPVTGYGYEAFWNPRNIDDVSWVQSWPIREAHSAYIESLLSIGLVGTLLVALGVLYALHAALKRYRQTGEPLFLFTFGMLVYGMINGFSESAMMLSFSVTFLLGCGVARTAVEVPEGEARAASDAAGGEEAGSRHAIANAKGGPA